MKVADIFRKLRETPGGRKAIYEGQYDTPFDASCEVEFYRMKKGLSQSQLAKRMRTKQSAISRAENGEITSLTFLDRAARALGMKVLLKLVPAYHPNDTVDFSCDSTTITTYPTLTTDL